MKEKKIFEEMRDMLVGLREHCVSEVAMRQQIITDKNGEIQQLIKTGEQFLGAQKIREDIEKHLQSSQKVTDTFGEKMEALKRKFEES